MFMKLQRHIADLLSVEGLIFDLYVWYDEMSRLFHAYQHWATGDTGVVLAELRLCNLVLRHEIASLRCAFERSRPPSVLLERVTRIDGDLHRQVKALSTLHELIRDQQDPWSAKLRADIERLLA